MNGPRVPERAGAQEVEVMLWAHEAEGSVAVQEKVLECGPDVWIWARVGGSRLCCLRLFPMQKSRRSFCFSLYVNHGMFSPKCFHFVSDRILLSLDVRCICDYCT